MLEEIAAFRAAHANAIWIGAYPAPSPDFAIAFGMGYSPQRVATTFEQAAGRPIMSLDRWNNDFYHAAGREDASYIRYLIRSGKVIILHVPGDYDAESIGLSLTPLAQFGDGSTAYRVEPAP